MMTHIIIAIVCFLCFDLTLLRHKRCIQVAFVGIFVGFLLSSTKSAYKSTRAGTARIIHNFKRPAALISATNAPLARQSKTKTRLLCGTTTISLPVHNQEYFPSKDNVGDLRVKTDELKKNTCKS